jgi:adenylate cyclase
MASKDIDKVPEETKRRMKRAREAVRRWDEEPRIVKGAKALRRFLPGDRDYGDPLSVAGTEPPHLLGQRLSALTAERPSAMREVGMSALQVWQSVSEAQGRGRGDREVTILFTDLVDFSTWALDAGDTMAVELLRRVGLAIEPPIEKRGGRIVKRLGDGLMAVFDEPQPAVEAASEAIAALEDLEVGGHNPQLRAGLHVGRPRSLGGDLFGVDVNIAARVAEAAGAGELLVSESACESLDEKQVSLSRKRRFKAKGAPKDLEVYAASLA